MFLCVVDVRNQKDFGVLLEDMTTESELTYTWENVWDIVTRYTKRRQWLGNEEKCTMELALRSRFVVENHQPQAPEFTAEKGIDATTVEQLLKGMENLKIVMVRKFEDLPTSSKYIDLQCIWCDSTKHDRRIAMSTRRLYDGISTREIGSI